MKVVSLLVLALISFNAVSSFLFEIAEDEDDIFTKELRKVEQDLANIFRIKNFTHVPMLELKKFANSLGVTSPISRNLQNKATCLFCKVLFQRLMLKLIPIGAVEEFLCSIFITFNTLTDGREFCKQIIDVHKPVLDYIIQNSKILDPELGCSLLMMNKDCYSYPIPLTWFLETPSFKKFKVPQVTSENLEPFQILQLTDFHLQPDYEPFSVADCKYPICCKRNFGDPKNGLNAGTWGDYRSCDTPLSMFEYTLQYIRENFPEIQYIYFTGDIVDHTVWNTSIQSNKDIISYSYKKLLEVFPDKLILPIIGNHESQVVNTFAPEKIINPDLNQKWLYDLLVELWEPWLTAEALRSVKEQGYYTIELSPKFRIIALNNNVCYNFNWWLMYDTNFIIPQLTWLRKVLEEAEANEQFVHILNHIPPGDGECIIPWEETYNNLISRFAHIIKGQFFGHTHTDEIKLFRRQNDSKPINVGFNGAALTPYVGYNPNFKVYKVDSNSFDVLDVDTYIFNLTEANANPNKFPRYYKSYSMREEYNLKDLKPDSIEKLTNKLFTDASIFEKYYANYVKRGDAALKEGCDNTCKKNVKCKTVTTVTLQSSKPECD